MLRHSPALAASFKRQLQIKALPSGNGLSGPLVLTYPCVDREGDYVNPLGGEWIAHPYVNWEHEIPVGMAASQPQLMALEHKGNSIRLPVGQTKFFQKASDLQGVNLKGHQPQAVLDMAKQAESLVKDEVIVGVSIEYLPLAQKPIGPSLLRGGKDAYRVDNWQGHGWAHCAQPVNPMAQSVVQDRIEKALRDNSQQFHPLITKSLQAAIKRNTAVTVQGADMSRIKPIVKKKAMEDEEVYGTPADMGEETAEDMPDDGDDAPAKSVQAKYNLCQTIRDAVQAFLDEVAGSDNPKVKADAQKFADKFLGQCDTVENYADNLHDQLTGSDEAEEPDVEMEPEAPTPVDDDGMIQPKGLKGSNWKPKSPYRIKASQLKAIQTTPKNRPGYTLVENGALS